MIDPFLTASQMISALRIREISSVELFELHEQRISRHDNVINAVIVRDFDRARQQAMLADNRLSQGQVAPLLGLPMTVKESVNVTGLRTCCGIEEARNFVSEHDGRNAARLKDAGAIIMGKTNIPVELADWQSNNPVYGRTNNPYSLDRSAGGSSGGSAAALAAGFTPLELGSDIGGSIRVPATLCGVYGHRPSETALAKSGQFPLPPTPSPFALLGVQGPMARSACDLRLAMSVLAGPEIGEDRAWRLELPEARHTRLQDFRVAALPLPSWAPIDPDMAASYHTMIESLRGLGVAVADAQPHGVGDWTEHYALYMRLLGAMLGARAPAAERDRRLTVLLERTEPTWKHFRDGFQASLADAFAWGAQRERYRAVWREFFETHDVLLAPSFMRPAFTHEIFDGAPLIGSAESTIDVDGQRVPYIDQLFFPSLSILTGQPATAFPTGINAAGLPLGLQAIGPYLEDLTPIAFIEALEAQGLSRFTPPPSLRTVTER